MQRHDYTVTDRAGNAVAGASVTVVTYPGLVSTAVYATDGGGAYPSNVLTTDANGRASFFLANGRYRVTISGTGITTQNVDDVLSFDPEDSGDVISVKDAGARGDGTTDDSAAIQAVIDALVAAGAGTMRFPAGKYRIASRLKIQNTYQAAKFIKIVGDGSGNQWRTAANTYGSILLGDTGGIAIDCAGGSNITIEDLGILPGTNNPSTIGILLQRTASNPYATNNKLIRVAIGMTPNAAANGGLGTFALVNKRGEHHHYQDCWFYADRPLLCDGSSVYPTLVSPDFAEATDAGYTLSLNYFDNCAFSPASGDAIELRSTSQMHFNGGYLRMANGKSGLLLGTFNADIDMRGVNGELESGSPLCFIRALGNVVNLTAHVKSGNVTNCTGIRTVSGAQVAGVDLQFSGTFQSLFDKTTESGGFMVGGRLVYRSSDGHTVPTSGIAGVVLHDNSAAITTGTIDVRPVENAASVFHTGAMAPVAATTGTDTTPSTTETYIAEVFIPCTTLLTGISVLNGSAVAGNIKLGLADRTGAVVAATASTAASGTAAYQKVAFTSAYLAKGPGKYFVLLQCDNAGNRFRSHALGNFGASKKTGEVYGTLTTITPPTTFTADQGPIADVYA